jgi:predicted ArsR family transcriptional regulator
MIARDETDRALLAWIRAHGPSAAAQAHDALGDVLGLSYRSVRTDLHRLARSGHLTATRQTEGLGRIAVLAGWRALYSIAPEHP